MAFQKWLKVIIVRVYLVSDGIGRNY